MWMYIKGQDPKWYRMKFVVQVMAFWDFGILSQIWWLRGIPRYSYLCWIVLCVGMNLSLVWWCICCVTKFCCWWNFRVCRPPRKSPMVHQHQKGGRGGKRRNCPRQSRRIREKEKPKMTKKRMRSNDKSVISMPFLTFVTSWPWLFVVRDEILPSYRESINS